MKLFLNHHYFEIYFCIVDADIFTQFQDKQCLSPGHYDRSCSPSHHFSSSVDVAKTYVYDPNTLTLVRRCQTSGRSFDYDDQRSGKKKNFLSREPTYDDPNLDSGNSPGGKQRSNSLRIKRGSKSAKKQRPSSSRNLRTKPEEGNKKEDNHLSPRRNSTSAVAPIFQEGIGLSPKEESSSSIISLSPSASRQSLETPPVVVQHSDITKSPEVCRHNRSNLRAKLKIYRFQTSY